VVQTAPEAQRMAAGRLVTAPVLPKAFQFAKLLIIAENIFSLHLSIFPLSSSVALVSEATIV